MRFLKSWLTFETYFIASDDVEAGVTNPTCNMWPTNNFSLDSDDDLS